ncbi:MAG TPA: efflux RND transporter periplasmic adaptor subunit [Niabella sp.]|jgi:membrane fusion protein (multidrug efflux system)|nr:efflux RND transporter periplasmic adaptor subunit [Niabella sp.]HRO84150.1 efflux RND transporter periplasmic adaptor subunit [Niabella sp.]HUN03673.1 efflux RND transporter periplasmic adaptor subunit [Niabella sp.]
MHYIFKAIIASILVFSIASCGGGKEKGKLGDKKVQLEKLKNQQKKLSEQIEKLEEEISVLDPSTIKAKLVSIETIDGESFSHYIDLQGKIDAKNVAYVAPRGMAGVVKALYVKKGDVVRKGQILAKLDDAVARQQVAAIVQQTDVLRTQLNLAKTALQRQQNLWDNNIGTEMQVIKAKADVEALSSQLRGVEAQVRMAKEQQNFSNIIADISGTIDQVNVRVGETFTGMSAGGPQISIVNTSVLKLLVNVPETYLDKVSVGTPLVITLPEGNNGKINTTVSVVSKLIDPSSRTFYIEANVPSDPSLRANQIAKVQIQDYSRPEAITIPVNTLQNDQQGKYVMVAVTENNKMVARKKRINVGQLYEDRLEVKAGLDKGDQLIIQGFENLYDGQLISKSEG